MPKAFDSCVKAGGKVRTVSLSSGKYARVCVRPHGAKGPRGGRTVMGEIRSKKK